MYDSKTVEMVNVWKYVEGKYNKGLRGDVVKICAGTCLYRKCVVSASDDFEGGDVPSRVWLYWFCMYDSKIVNERNVFKPLVCVYATRAHTL
jgi:hypothetical protein